MKVGVHVEGYDHLIFHSLLAKLLLLPEDTIDIDRVGAIGLGWHQVLETLPKALMRFRGKACALAVIGIDNDGTADLVATGNQEASEHPRHWLHATRHPNCRHCQLEAVVAATRQSRLGWDATIARWPIVIAVPVEAIEAWLLVIQAILGVGGSLRAERERRQGMKQCVYGRLEATREDIERITLPQIRALTKEQLLLARSHCQSLKIFAAQVEAFRQQQENGAP